MNRIFLVLVVIMASCLKQDPPLPKVVLELPTWKHQFCMASPTDTNVSERYYYKNDRMVKKEVFARNTYSVTDYFYNANNKIELERTQSSRRTASNQYFYSSAGFLERKQYTQTFFDTAGIPTDSSTYSTLYQYKSSLLIQENYHWGGKTTYEYSKGRVSKRVDHNSFGREHHITHYTYQGLNIVKLKKETVGGILMNDMKFFYDEKSRLTSVTDFDKIVESNLYDGLKLIEKRVFYHGIDPGFSPCNGNYIYMYEY
jgi:hypothetical protein